MLQSSVNMLGVCYACQSTAPIGSHSCPKCGITDPYRLADLREILGIGPIPGLFAGPFLVACIVTGLSMVALSYFGWNRDLALWIGGIIFIGFVIMVFLSHINAVEVRRTLVEATLARQMAELAGANPSVSIGEATTAISGSLRTNKPPAVLVDAIAAAFARRQAAPQQ